MGSYLLVILLTSVITSCVTLALAWFLYRRVWEPRLDARLAELQDEFERRVKSGVLAAGRELQPEFEGHVKAGVLAAGEELLPAFRRNVADGFRDAIRELHPAGLAGDAAKAVSSAADLLGNSLGNLFGLKRRD